MHGPAQGIAITKRKPTSKTINNPGLLAQWQSV